jgi:hypothetical protein
MKEDMEKRELKCRTSVLLVEMGMVDDVALRLYNLLDHYHEHLYVLSENVY